MNTDYRDTESSTIRTLFCFGVRSDFFAAPAQQRAAVIQAIRTAFDDLAGRFGVQVLGTMDDDEIMVGPSDGFPWTAYILADAPSYEAVTSVCNQVRETEVDGTALWKYLKVEARLGRRLFFGNQ